MAYNYKSIMRQIKLYTLNSHSDYKLNNIMAVKTKAFWKSSTLWINGLGLITVVLSTVLDLKVIKDTEVIALLVAVLNIANRFRPVEVKKLSLK